MKLTREEVYKLIDTEREYQGLRWNQNTTITGGNHTPTEWLVFIQDYLTEAMHVSTRQPAQECDPIIMANLRKIAGMCVAAMEELGCAPRDIEAYKLGVKFREKLFPTGRD
jgi:hypothetical protein